VCRYRVILDFTVKLLTEHDHVLTVAGQELLIRVTRVPDARLRHDEVEAGAMNDSRTFSLAIRSEEDRCPKDSLERGDQTPVLRTALLHHEGVQHGSGALERNLG